MKKIFYFLLIHCFLMGSVFADSAVEQVVILGSGPAGLTAAIYTSRAGLSTLVVEGAEAGGQIALSYMVDNFPGFQNGINGYDLAQNLRNQAIRFGTKVKNGRVVQIDLTKRPFTLTFDEGEVLHTETLIIATGASAKWLGLESEKAFIGNGVSSCAVCDGVLYKDKEVVVVGGGDTALEDALFLANYAAKVTVIHRRDTLKASKFLRDKAFINPKIQFVWNHVVEEIADPSQNTVTGVILKNVLTGQKQSLACEGVFVAIGHQPNTDIFKGQINLTESGYIVTEPFCTLTSVPGVFAAGDVADSHYRQAVTAAGTGCMAGIDAYHFIQKHH